MKSNKYLTIILFLLILILLFYSSYLFIILAKKNQTWPFNSGLGEKLPNFIKKTGHSIALEDEDILSTHYYEIKKENISIPSLNAIGVGGAVNIIDNKNILITLNNGELLTFNHENKIFSEINEKIQNYYLSIRDVAISYDDNRILILAIKEEGDCHHIALDSYNYEISDNFFSISNKNSVWKSEDLCVENYPVEMASGGRIIIKNNSYYISTGMMFSKYGSGINSFPQDKNSSFGKILKINLNNNNSVYSLGHRNPQGLFISKSKNLLISTEHGPAGGDEINIINEKNNYGWPCITSGTLYEYANNKTNNLKNMWPQNLEEFFCNNDVIYTKPLYTWTPSIAISQGFEYQNEYFSKFKNNFIIGSLLGMSIFRLNLSENNNVMNVEQIKINERVRDLIEIQDGRIIIYTDNGNLIILSKNNS